MAKILIIDDSMVVRRRFKKLLIELGHEVEEAGDGVQAVSAYTSFSPELVFCDVTMPDVDGIEVVKGIIAINKDAKIVMMTAMDEQTILNQAKEAGALDYILKPVEQDLLVQTLHKMLVTPLS